MTNNNKKPISQKIFTNWKSLQTTAKYTNNCINNQYNFQLSYATNKSTTSYQLYLECKVGWTNNYNIGRVADPCPIAEIPTYRPCWLSQLYKNNIITKRCIQNITNTTH